MPVAVALPLNVPFGILPDCHIQQQKRPLKKEDVFYIDEHRSNW